MNEAIVRLRCGHTQVERGLGKRTLDDFVFCRKCGLNREVSELINRTHRERDKVVASCYTCDSLIQYWRVRDGWAQLDPPSDTPTVCPGSLRGRHTPQ